MKTIKIKFVGFWQGFNVEKNLLVDCIRKNFDIQIVENNPDYIICSVFNNAFEYCNYPQIRIMLSGENYVPDFNLIDYAISSYPISFFDRHFRLPVFLIDNPYQLLAMESGRNNYNQEFIKSKRYFANFIVGHESEKSLRGDFFHRLSEYKRVESCGRYLNNMPDGFVVSRQDKIDFQKKCKFTICFESTSHYGFITEKITDAFLSGTIPIYYGSQDITSIFNKKAFINCADYKSFDDVIEKIIELDNDDEKYLQMLNQPIFIENNYVSNIINMLEQFLMNIFNQPYENAYRRSRCYTPMRINNLLISQVVKTKKKAHKKNVFTRIFNFSIRVAKGFFRHLKKLFIRH